MTPAGPPRVALVLTQDRGGPVEVCLALARELHRTGAATVRVFGPRPARGTGVPAELFTESGVGDKTDVAAGRALLSRIADWGPDLVHAHDRRAGLVLATAAWRRRRPRLLQTYHGVPEDVGEAWFRGTAGAPAPSRYTRATLAADAVVGRVLDRTVVCAEPMRRFLSGRLRLPARRLVHIDNGLDLGPSDPPAGPVRHLVTAGLLLPRKGITDLIDALERPGVFPADATLTVVGDGPERPAIEARAAASGGRIRLLGFRADVPELMRAADAVAVPSRMEQQPLVVIEAMAAGKPVLATDTGDTATMLAAPGAARFIATPGDPESLATALRALFADPDPGLTGTLLAARAAERYSAPASARSHLALYRSLLGRPARDGRLSVVPGPSRRPTRR